MQNDQETDGKPSAPSPGPGAPDRDRADFGVLLVHGIGDSAEGDTLLGFGEPLLDWMREWMAAHGPDRARGQIHVVSATLQAPRGQDEPPAHAHVRIAPGAAGGPQQAPPKPQDWIFAEAWWAGIVRAPSPARLLGWMLSRIPLMVVWHLYARSVSTVDLTLGLRDKVGPLHFLLFGPRYLQLVSMLVRVAAASLLGFALQAVTLLALALIWVPIGRWRSAVLTAVRTLTLTLGDSYVLLEQDFQRAALAERVRRALRWMGDRCERVMVVAHSQGGAVAHEALKGASLERVDSFVTVGSGFEKLEFLRLVRERRLGIKAATWAGPLLALALAVPAAHALRWVEGAPSWWVAPGLILGFTCVMILTSLIVDLNHYHASIETMRPQWPLADGDRPIAWFDAYATLDLVPQGSNSQLGGVAQQCQVANEWSLAFDHVRYFQTRCDFAAWCWQRMDERSGLGALSASDRAALERLRRWHARRGAGLSLGAAVAPVGVVLACLLLPATMASFGKGALDLLGRAGFDTLRNMLDWASSALASAWTWMPSMLRTADSAIDPAHVVAGAIPLVAGVVGWWLLTLTLWRGANAALWRRVCRGRSRLAQDLSVQEGLLYGWMPVAAWSALAMGPTLVGCLLPWSSSMPGLAALGVLAGATLSGVLVLSGFAMGAGLPWIASAMSKRFDFGRATGPVVILLYGWLAVSALVSGGMLWESVYQRSHQSVLLAAWAGLTATGWLVWWMRRARTQPSTGGASG